MRHRPTVGSWMPMMVLACALCVLAGGCRGGSMWQPFGERGLLARNDSRPWQRDSRPKRGLLDERSLDRVLLEDLSPSELATTWKVKTRLKADPERAEAEFATGQQRYREALAAWQDRQADTAHRQKFHQAARHFRLAASAWPDSALEQDALFLLGESYFFADRYVQANRAYEQLIAYYSGTRFMDQVQARRFTIAQYWMELSRRQSAWAVGLNLTDPKRPSRDLAGEARRIFHRIRLDDPTGQLADDATMALANAYLEAGRFIEAADTYEDLRRTYSFSRHAFMAHMLELKARLSSYRGRDYNPEPLEKADKLLQAMVRNFPREVQEHRQFLEKEGVRVRTLLAERDMRMGNYYSRRGENRAAIMYFESVASQYQDTPLAAEAREQVASLSGKPPEPAQTASWLVNLFPDPKATRPLIASGDNESILVR